MTARLNNLMTRQLRKQMTLRAEPIMTKRHILINISREPPDNIAY